MLEKPSKQRAILIGGAIISVISGLPGLSIINCCCCAGIIIGGGVAATIYQKDFLPEHPPLETSDVLMVGLLSGLFGAVGATVLSVLFMLAMGPIEAQLMAEVWDKVIERLVESGTIPDSVADTMREQFETAIEQGLSFSTIVAGFFVNVIVFPIFGMLGGLIGYGITRKKTPPVPLQ